MTVTLRSPARPKTLIFATVAAALAFTATGSATVDFTREVQPILAEHCFHCHGPDDKDRKAGYRIDLRDPALKGGRSDLAGIVPGKPAESEIIARIFSTDSEEVMPPPKENKPLSAAQKETLKRWVAEGAPYAQHWAFVPPAKAPLPEANATKAIAPASSTTNPVDAFVEAKLRAVKLAPSAPADPAVLCRRIHLDLIGLPPAPKDVAEFVAAAAATGLPSAVESLSKRLMADPRFGERWARVWLDAARYADSNGFEKDLPREQWAWRDWVINAFNRDQPYDQFIIEQLAGDLIPGATQDQIIATGFLRNGMVNEEGAIIPEQFRIEGMFDRMDCVGKAVMGLSLQCAQCHTHKFDPVTHDEYFGLYAFLNNTYEAQSWVYSEEQQKEISRIRSDLWGIDERAKKALPEWREQIAAWEAGISARRPKWTPIEPYELASTSGLNHPVQLADKSILTLGHPTTRGDIFVLATPELTGVTGLQLEALNHGDLEFGGPGRSKYGTWALSELEVSTQVPGSDKWEKVSLRNATADFAEAVRGLEEEWKAGFDKERKRIVGPADFMIDGSNDTAWRADRGPGRRNSPSVAVVRFAEPLTLPAGTKIKVLLRMHHSGDDNGRHNTALGCCRISLTNAPDPKAEPVDYAAVLAFATPAAERTGEQQATIFRAWRATVADAKKFNTEAENLWKKFPIAGSSVLHLAERGGIQTRATKLLDRGSWDKPKHDVAPHVPTALNPWPEGAPRDRLQFARWVVAPQSPLAARVAVNRVWQAVFGVGLVETPEDFGTRTPVPEHRDLLDWLAVDFMENCWSHKHLLRTIIASRTYQQSSVASPALLERDPANRLLARGARFRGDAEVVRDSALTIAGLLHPRIGGPSIFPPVPENVLAYNYVRPTYWNPPQDAERYRRSLYLFRKRSMPDPMLSAFDAPNGDFACARRPRSNTPLAALTSLNEPVFVEASQALALRIWREGGATDESRADYAYRLCTSRGARPAEIAALRRLLEEKRGRLRSGELKAAEIAFSAFTKTADLPADATPADLAAWAIVARVLLNLDETLTKS
jgi:mono/diheme cytochrome c family protein